MATTHEEIYKRFLKKVDDYDLYKLAEVNESDLKEVLRGYLDTAILYFQQCKKDLETIILVDGIDSNNNPIKLEAFKDDLTNIEKEIIVQAMKIAWLEPKLMSAELMNKDIGDRDYKSIQGHPYIREISALKTSLENKVRIYTVQYTYNGFSLEDW